MKAYVELRFTETSIMVTAGNFRGTFWEGKSFGNCITRGPAASITNSCRHYMWVH